MTLSLPGTADYESRRRPEIPRYADVRPAGIVACRTDDDVAAALAYAREHGLPVVARSGGHCFAGGSSTTGVLVDVSPMRSVSVDGGVVTVGAGVRLGELYAALDAHGLTVPAGCGPTVGIAGLTLGGGFGVLGRAHGLTCDRLLAATVVLADGRVVECDEDRHGDLFWALRGAGGGRFGIVTELVLRAVPAPEVTVFHLERPLAEAASVIDEWQRWAPDAPDDVSASLLITAGTRNAVNVFGVGTAPGGATTWHGPYLEAKRRLVELGERMAGPEHGGGTVHRSEYFDRPLPRTAIEALVAQLDGGDGLRELDFTPWGGAYNRVPATATAFAHRGARFLLKHATDREDGWLDRSWASAHPWGTGGVYPNFPEPGRAAFDPAYHGVNRERLLRVKAAYNPDGCNGAETQ